MILADMSIMLAVCREACTIDMGEYVVVTGGAATPRQVTAYRATGWEADLPSLGTGRRDHACGHYVNSDNHGVRGGMVDTASSCNVSHRCTW